MLDDDIRYVSEIGLIMEQFRTRRELGRAISAGIIGFFNLVRIGRQGFMREFWDGLLGILRTQPESVDEQYG